VAGNIQNTHSPQLTVDVVMHLLSTRAFSFADNDAQGAFFDPKRVIAEVVQHSEHEPRHFCIGEVAGGIVTVRFTYRKDVIRMFGAGYWRKGKRIF
jgi:uncharacterized DUF497 family protein